MTTLGDLYGRSLALLTDLYQLTMAYAYWKSGTHTKEAVFNLFFREHPFRGGFTVACGLARALEFMEQLRFAEQDLAYLATLTGNDGRPLFEAAFLDYLRQLRFTCDVDAVQIPQAVVKGVHVEGLGALNLRPGMLRQDRAR